MEWIQLKRDNMLNETLEFKDRDPDDDIMDKIMEETIKYPHLENLYSIAYNKRKIEYNIVSSDAITELSKLVEQLINEEGWSLHGYPFSHDGRYAQGLLKEL